MRPPDISNRTKCFLFGTNEGNLALYSFNQDRWMAELWILQDYKNEAWALTYRIQAKKHRYGTSCRIRIGVCTQYFDISSAKYRKIYIKK
jgi:hypothetical protein